MGPLKYSTEELHAAFCVFEWMLKHSDVYGAEIQNSGIQRTRDRIADIGIRIDHAFDRSKNSDDYTGCFDLEFIPAVLDLLEHPFDVNGAQIAFAVEVVLAENKEAGQ